MAALEIPGVNIPLLEGPLVLGYMWSYMLYGILIVQMYLYWINFPKDQVGIKIYVWFMFLLETIFTIFTTIAAWDQFGANWGDPQSLLVIDWSWEPLPSLNGLIAMMVQSFYIWRIFNLTRNVYIAILIECVSLMQCVMAWYFGITVSLEGRGVDKLFGLTSIISAWLVGAAVCDVLITVVIVFVLSRANKRTKFKQTTDAITRLIRFTVETGLITSFAAVVELILWLTTQHYNIHFIGFLVLGKLYSNALVATLNSRAAIFGDPQGYKAQIASSQQQTTSAFWDDTRSRNVNVTTSASAALRAHTVHVSRTTELNTDHEMVVVSDFKGNDLEGAAQKPTYHRDF